MYIQENKVDSEITYAIRGSLSGTEKSTIRLFETVSIAADKRPKKIILDIEHVSYMDSMSTGLLVGMLLKCKENKIAFQIANIPPHLVRILDATNLKKIFPDLY